MKWISLKSTIQTPTIVTLKGIDEKNVQLFPLLTFLLTIHGPCNMVKRLHIGSQFYNFSHWYWSDNVTDRLILDRSHPFWMILSLNRINVYLQEPTVFLHQHIVTVLKLLCYSPWTWTLQTWNSRGNRQLHLCMFLRFLSDDEVRLPTLHDLLKCQNNQKLQNDGTMNNLFWYCIKCRPIG